jgi:hypothetical protein
LSSPIDFLKVGHHGSVNATPPHTDVSQKSAKAQANGIYTVLDTILPVPKAGAKPTASAVVSTEREFYETIPSSRLLVDMARRVWNTRRYGKDLRKKGIDPKSIWLSPKAKKFKFFENYERDFLDSPQPLRTDLEFVLHGRGFVDIEIQPAE